MSQSNLLTTCDPGILKNHEKSSIFNKCIIFLIAGQIVEMKDPAKTFQQIGAYFGTVIAGLVIHGLIVLPTVYGK